MSGQRQPLELVIAKGNKHLTKAEIEERRMGQGNEYRCAKCGVYKWS